VHVCAACVTVTGTPAIVRVPVLELVDVFALTEYVTVPLPVPDAPAVMVIHDALLAADQAHVEATVTVAFSDPPLAPGL
jgi:hypothetical protein